MILTEEQSGTDLHHVVVSMEKAPGPPYPLHDSVKDKLHPEYVRFYNSTLINLQQAHRQPIAVTRSGGQIAAGGSHPIPVGSVQDFCIQRKESCGPNIMLRTFFPSSRPPKDSAWPVMLFYHGGGWVLGNIDSENTVCSHMCMRAQCVVITTDYRLAPEHPFPAALEDCWETVLWLQEWAGFNLPLDTTRVAIGGCSSGANLATVIAVKAMTRTNDHTTNFRLCQQILVVPPTDNSATTDNNPTWKQFEHTAALSAEKMLWYRGHYLPGLDDRVDPRASPLYLPIERVSGMPPTLIVVGGCDILRHEGEEYARRLEAAGVQTRLEVMHGMPHPFVAMDAVLEAGRATITLMCDALITAFSGRR